MISTHSINPTYLAGTAPVPGVQPVQGVQGMPAQANAFGINPAGYGIQSFVPQTLPTQAWATQGMPTQAPTDAERINAFVGAAFNEANSLLAQSTMLQAQQQQAQPQAMPTTVAPSASIAGLQVPTQPTAPATPTLQAGQSVPQAGQIDGGNIAVRMPQTGQLAWVPESQLMAMYQQAATAPEQQGKVQLATGQWVDKATVKTVLDKLQARLTLQRLRKQGQISDDDLEKAGGNQDLQGVLAAGKKEDTRLAKRREAQEYVASARDSLLGDQNPYASLGGGGGGVADAGSIG